MQPREAEMVAAGLDPVDGQRRHARRRADGTEAEEAAGEPGTQHRHLPGHDRIGLHEDRGPADPCRRAVASLRDRRQLHRPLDREQRDVPGDERDVATAARAAGSGRGGDGGVHICRVPEDDREHRDRHRGLKRFPILGEMADSGRKMAGRGSHACRSRGPAALFRIHLPPCERSCSASPRPT